MVAAKQTFKMSSNPVKVETILVLHCVVKLTRKVYFVGNISLHVTCKKSQFDVVEQSIGMLKMLME